MSTVPRRGRFVLRSAGILPALLTLVAQAFLPVLFAFSEGREM